jgi:hypothetical protein
MAVMAGYDVLVCVDTGTGGGGAVLASQRNVTFTTSREIIEVSDKGSSFDDATCTFSSGSTGVTMTSTALVEVGMSVTGTGVGTSTKVESVTNSTTLVLSVDTTGAASPGTLTFSKGPAYTTDLAGKSEFQYSSRRTIRFSVEALYDDGTNSIATNPNFSSYIRNDNAGTGDTPSLSPNANMLVWRRDARSGSMDKIEKARFRLESIEETHQAEDVSSYIMNLVMVIGNTVSDTQIPEWVEA